MTEVMTEEVMVAVVVAADLIETEVEVMMPEEVADLMATDGVDMVETDEVGLAEKGEVAVEKKDMDLDVRILDVLIIDPGGQDEEGNR